MDKSSILLVCMLLLACSAWTGHGRSFELRIDDHEPGDEEASVEASVEASKLPGVCWACKWALKKVKKAVGPNGTAEVIKAKLLSVCDQIGLLKSLCRKFVTSHLGVLIEELTTTDDVKTICVSAGACKEKDLMELLYFPREEEAEMNYNE